MFRAEVVQDVPEPPVHLFEDGHMLLGRPAPEPTEPGNGVIHPRVTGSGCFNHAPFGIMVLIFIACTLAAAGQ
jgi:hypothetical protein